MARPRGEIRQALNDALTRLAAERGPVPGREVAAAAQVGYEAARITLKNMTHAGEVQVSGKDKPAGAAHWHNLYEPVAPQDRAAAARRAAEEAAEEAPQAWGGIETLASAMRAWPADV